MIQQREQFLNNIAAQLNRPVRKKAVRPTWQFTPQKDVLKDATSDELMYVLEQQCQNIHTKFVTTTTKMLATDVQTMLQQASVETLIVPKDDRFSTWSIEHCFESFSTHIWSEQTKAENVAFAEQADAALIISEMTLAESGSAVLFSDPTKGRTLNFLPKKIFVLIPKSSIVPRITQAAAYFHKKVKSGQHIPSNILFMTGPSNSADIEMVLIVGVHGPIEATYIVVEDL